MEGTGYGGTVPEPRRSKSSSPNSSSRVSGAQPSQIDDELGDESVSEVGDIGDRALHSNRSSSSQTFSYLNVDVVLPSYGFGCRDHTASRVTPTVPLPEEVISLSVDVVRNEDKKQENTNKLPKWLDYGSSMTHLAFFGILGVLTRNLLQKLFGPGVAGVTSDQTILYLDLPSNMVGSFLMGWWGIVFKADIAYVSDFLAIGLSTGYLGSLTTFSGWNQKMLELSVQGHWLFALLGFVIGLFLAAYSIIFGIETAKGFRHLLKRCSGSDTTSSRKTFRVGSYKRHVAVWAVLLVMLGCLWSVSGILMEEEFRNDSSETHLWLACIVGPVGVWIRWFLARLNGRGLGKTQLLKWVPFGTLIANVSAACIMAALATVKKEVNTKTCDIIANGVQFGFLGCLSTVSTFISEFDAMRESKQPWKAYAYAMVTVCASFFLGTLIFSLPVWTKAYR
ncbi:fluoride export protein 1 isoform X2 [Argentina anserina]|nr:fluoride export protein 1 isoform X2 [Potentilla anserina]XP_050364881.1 fluoride export protein 1 isoform X2 [Potentilla anserina]XP_050364882.1 fluoride export protein 1 isoform X2 [Potentilla anserina]XP_050364883.1 fluoride export protein 1 isoform X2 [Potentilla anserina]XP_050364884.1 fluoride export protein 1 isoform X2 [Potentilla anserina]